MTKWSRLAEISGPDFEWLKQDAAITAAIRGAVVAEQSSELILVA
jgi:hypothetical protein